MIDSFSYLPLRTNEDDDLLLLLLFFLSLPFGNMACIAKKEEKEEEEGEAQWDRLQPWQRGKNAFLFQPSLLLLIPLLGIPVILASLSPSDPSVLGGVPGINALVQGLPGAFKQTWTRGNEIKRERERWEAVRPMRVVVLLLFSPRAAPSVLLPSWLH